jgi:hypothetical protein
MEILMFAILLIILVVVALLKGVDSRDGIDSPEWKRRWGRRASIF